MDLRTGGHKPFMKPNNTPLYVHTKSNHSPNIIKKHPRKHQQKTIEHIIKWKNIPKGNPTLPRHPQNKSCQKPTTELVGRLGEKLNISPLDIGHKWSDVGLKVIINIDTNHRCLYSIYILQHYTKQCPKEY